MSGLFNKYRSELFGEEGPDGLEAEDFDDMLADVGAAPDEAIRVPVENPVVSDMDEGDVDLSEYEDDSMSLSDMDSSMADAAEEMLLERARERGVSTDKFQTMVASFNKRK